MACLDQSAVAQLVAGQLSPRELATVDLHLDECPKCRRAVAERALSSESIAMAGTGIDTAPERRGARRAPDPPAPAAIPLTSASGELSPLGPGDDPLIGRVILGRYRIVGKLGGGGMGSVYEAEHALIGRRVAIKVLHPQFAASQEVVRRFQNEARAAATLGHPGILQALDMGRTEDGMPFLVLELLEGEDLDAVIAREGSLPIHRAVQITLDIADAIGAAHAAGIIHRDLKPENVFLTDDGILKVLDFGISKIKGSFPGSALTGAGAMMGTPHYMAPEQFEDAASADPRSDVYALGVLLFRAITGRFPFEASSIPQLLLRIVSGAPPRLDEIRPDAPIELGDALERAMTADPAARFESMEAFAEAIRPFRHRRPGSEIPPPRRDEQRVATVLVAIGAVDAGALQRLLPKEGARIVSSGDPFVAVFGEETWLGDETRRAALAALSIRPMVEAAAVASGHLLFRAGDVEGEPIDRALTACDAELAGVALVLSAEGAGGVAARASALDEDFVTREVTAELLEVVRRRSRPGSQLDTFRGASQPLLGRDAEVALLRDASARAADEERPAVVAVTGPVGIGKTRLAAELLRLLDVGDTTFRVLVGRARPGPGSRLGLLTRMIDAHARAASELAGAPSIAPDAPIEERRKGIERLVREATGGDPPADARLGAFLGELLGVPMPTSTPLSAARGNPRLMADQLELAVREYLVRLASHGPTALLVEDLQWADLRSLELLAEVVDACADRPLLVFGTARDDAMPQLMAPFDDDEVLRIRPRGLGVTDVKALASWLTGREIDDGLARALVDRTGGTPFFVEQMLSTLADQNRLDDTLSEMPLPLDVEAAVQSRLDSLTEAERETLKLGSVIGSPFAADELVALGGEDVDGALASLARRGLVRRRASGHEMRSSLVADVAYRMMTDDVRRRLHLEAAELQRARADADPELVAMHFERGGATRDASRTYVRAALAALRQHDTEKVMRTADRALALGLDEADRFAVHMARSDALEAEGRFDGQGPELEAALNEARTAEERAQLFTAYGVWRLRTEGPKEAIASLEEAVDAAHVAGDPRATARALGRLATALVYAGDLDRAAGTLSEAERLVATRAPALRADAASWRAQLATAQGDLGARQAAYATAVELYAESGDLRSAAGAAVNLADVQNRFGAYADAERALSEALERVRRLRIRHVEGYALANLGYALGMQGRAEEAAAALAESLRLATEIGDARLSLFARLYRARLTGASGDLDAASRDAKAVAEEAAPLGLPQAAALGHVIAATVALSRGDAGEALVQTREAMRIREELGGLEEDEAEVFVAHAAALEAAGHAEEAASVRTEGRRVVRTVAQRILDPEARARFLQDVPANAALALGSA